MKCLVFALIILCLLTVIDNTKCPLDILVMYRMILHTEWSEEKFPKQYPEWRPPAQWSVVVGRSHNASGLLWRFGKTASDSIKLFVETGKADLLIREGIKEKKGVLSEFFAPPVTQGVGETEAKFFVDAFHSKVSIICRITPSPDWFIGVDSYNLCHGNKWVDSMTLDLEPIDGGTDNGYTFTSPKWTTDPRSNITLIKSRSPDHPASSFFYPELEKLPRIAYVKFMKMKEFFLNKQITRDLSDQNLTVESIFSSSTRASVISSVNDMEKFPLHIKKAKTVKRKKEFQDGIFSSKPESTVKSKVRKIHKQNRLVRSTTKQRGFSVATVTIKDVNKGSMPCRVSEWSEWGQCNNSCGFGERVRRRKVTHLPTRSGRPCPPLQESKWCRSLTKCNNETLHLFRWQ